MVFGLVVCWPPHKGELLSGARRRTCTFFTRSHIFDEINDSLKRFWEIDTLGIQENDVKILSGEKELALDKTRLSLTKDEQRYQVATPCKTDCPTLPNNYEMACSRLRNTEKRLIRQSSVGEDYQANGLLPPTLTKGTSARCITPRTSRKSRGIDLISRYAVLKGQLRKQESYLMPVPNFRILP